MKKANLFLIASIVVSLSSCDHLKKEIGDISPGFTVQSVFPVEGEPGISIKLRGHGFGTDSTQDVVLVNGVKATILHVSDTTIEALLPDKGAVTAQIRVLVKGIPSQGVVTFHYTDVYVTGSVTSSTGQSNARLWKNGTIIPLFSDTATNAFALAFDSGNLYVGTNGGYYKNATFIPLAKENVVRDIKFHNNSIYVTALSGYYRDGVYTLLLKSGLTTPVFNSIAFDGDSMYVVGSYFYGLGAIEYKNDRRIPLTPNEFHGSAYVVTINDHKDYVGGEILADNEGYEWVNAKGTAFPNLRDLNDIVFRAGSEYDAVVSRYANTLYLKDKVMIPIPDTTVSFFGSSLALTANSIYVAGFQSASKQETKTDAVYYRNGKLVKLDKGQFNSARANRILLVKR